MTISNQEDQNPQKMNNKQKDNLEGSLTPWQLANREYRKQQDNQWSPTVIEGQQTNQFNDAPLDDNQEEPLGVRPAVEETTSFSDRLPKVKYQRNTTLYRRMSFLIFLMLIPLVVIIYWVSPLGKLADVSVIGNEKVTESSIVQAASFQKSEELWPQFFEKKDHLAAVKKDQPRVKKVTLAIKNFNHFVLTIQEHQEVAVLAKDNHYSPILDNGVVLAEKSANPTAKMPILENFNDQKLILNVLQAYHELSQQLQEAVSQIRYTPTKENLELLKLYMNDGNQVIVNISNLPSQMKYYSQVAKEMKEKGVIDMEVGIFSYPYDNEKISDSAEKTTTTSSSQE